MFAFFKRKSAGKPEAEPTAPERSRTLPSAKNTNAGAVATKPPSNDNDVTREKISKDVVNLLLPQTDYPKATTLWDIMAGRKKKKKKNITRTESCKELAQQKDPMDLRRSLTARSVEDVTAPTPPPSENNAPTHETDSQYVRQLVLQKYANKPQVQAKPHVSLVYVEDSDGKRRAESLLREIARSIDCTVDQINEKTQMGANDSRVDRVSEPYYETVEDNTSIRAFKEDLKEELERLLDKEADGGDKKKSNLKPPKSDTEGCSDDDRSDCAKKRVTFTKHIHFDDGEQQTDGELDSSFESISSEEEEDPPDNDELLGGEVVARNDAGKPVERYEEDVELKRISSDNSDSGFLEISEKQNTEDCNYAKVLNGSESESEVSGSGSETEEEISVEEEEVVARVVEPNRVKLNGETKNLVTEGAKFQSQVDQLTELEDVRCCEASRTKDVIARYRRDIQAKELEIERLKSELAAAYKESELVRQRSRSLEEELGAARSCSADLADKLGKKNDEKERQLSTQLEQSLARGADLEAKVKILQRDRDRLENEKSYHEKRAEEALAAAEANTSKWRTAHEAARTQAAARAERMLADCEWKMRELERKARDADKQRTEITKTLEQVRAEKSQPSASHVAELQQLRGLASEQQRSVQALTAQLQKVETREEALKLEVHRLKELLEKETRTAREKEERYLQTLERLETGHAKALDAQRAEQAVTAACTRAAMERVQAERTRQALSQLRAEAERDARNADRKLREVTTRFENLKEVMASKEAQFEKALSEAHSKADWDILQLRHLLDKADITYANNIEQANERFEREKERLIEEWSEKLRVAEEQATSHAEEARVHLEKTKSKLIAEKNEMINKLKEQHKNEMDEQWEQFMSDKESCLDRMKTECRQEGEEERVKREKDLLEEIAELKNQIQSKSTDFDNLAVKAATCGRTLAVTEQELKEALIREKEMREKRSEDAGKIKQAERANKDQIEHLTRKCACLRKLFDDMRARLSARERDAEQEAKARERELHQLRAEVTRLTRLLLEQGFPKIGDRTQADGCDATIQANEHFFSKAEPLAFDAQQNAPRRKGGTLRTPEPIRRQQQPKTPEGFRTRPNFPELAPIPPERRLNQMAEQNGRRRSKSVDLPAVQVPVRIRQLEGLSNQ